jgi:putative transposase
MKKATKVATTTKKITMPYEYRKMSAKERQEIVELRKQRGYPLHSPPHLFREAGCYLITAANFEHQAVMAAPERRTEFQQLLLDAFYEINAEVIAWAVLSNHYHILVNVETLEAVSCTLHHLHGFTSHKWNREDGQTGKRKVWYHFFDRMMRNETHLYQTFNYIHYNPVKHGLVENIYDWSWSSLLLYENDNRKDWLQMIRDKYPTLPDFGNDWDEW